MAKQYSYLPDDFILLHGAHVLHPAIISFPFEIHSQFDMGQHTDVLCQHQFYGIRLDRNESFCLRCMTRWMEWSDSIYPPSNFRDRNASFGERVPTIGNRKELQLSCHRTRCHRRNTTKLQITCSGQFYLEHWSTSELKLKYSRYSDICKRSKSTCQFLSRHACFK